MTLTCKLLGPEDVPVLEYLAVNDPDFDLEGRGEPLEPLSPSAARRFLADPAVLFWIARDGAQITGFLYCLVVPLRSSDEQELLLYEIGVQREWRRRGIGRTLLDHMEGWMRTNGVGEVWVFADNLAAVNFYRARAFEVADSQPVYMTHRVR
ncbi:MAG TPA: GNAT family N-acetyltransferase [Gemmatimonadaceae bacterium]|nr:GNAT family N-acetyltransferase [Gemmatimonadaceae bacterium]